MVSYFWRLQSVKKRKILIKFNARLEKRRRLLAGKRAKSNESLMEITAAKTLPAVLHYAFNFITQPVGKGKSRPVLSWPIKSRETLVKSARRPKPLPLLPYSLVFHGASTRPTLQLSRVSWWGWFWGRSYGGALGKQRDREPLGGIEFII